jgi:hypothetical protein
VTAASIRSGFLRPLRFRGLLAGALAVAALVLVFGRDALADCGDSIDGERVACRCGDVVVADTRLQPDDPIVTEQCPADGLLVRAPSQSQSIVVDLNGQEIRGSGAGSGIHILHGGFEGAEIVGGIGSVPGTISGFREGVRSVRPNDLRLLANVVVRDSRDSGIVVRGNRASIESVRIDGSGADGLRTSGRSVDLLGVETEGNGRRGVRDHASAGEREVTSQVNGSVDAVRGQRGR